VDGQSIARQRLSKLRKTHATVVGGVFSVPSRALPRRAEPRLGSFRGDHSPTATKVFSAYIMEKRRSYDISEERVC
jgi:hypothetical protein